MEAAGCFRRCNPSITCYGDYWDRESVLVSFYAHYEDVPASAWRWPNFTPKEIASKGNGSLLVHEPSMDALQKLRDMLGRPIIINSAYRDPAHNKAVGGSKMSMHLEGKAFDIALDGHDKVYLRNKAEKAGFTGFGYYNTFLHVDTGRERFWGTPW